ncbi:MAG TPA: Rid family hydrolase [Longimicrobiales bacterium]|nr:Rid family hydrolase [Longimicrobiales bacterium]
MRPVYAVAFAALLCAQPLAAQAAPRIAHKPAAGRPYSAAVQVGDMYWFAGKVGNTPETQALTTGRTAAETRNIMEAFKTLMTELGLDFGDVVQATVYLVDIDDFAEMNQVYGAYFPTDPPARETVAVKDLVGGAALEISFVAVKR